ncbi:Restriction endonuclease type I HsdR N-terminal [Penicillium waksmanii]|uniref:Restriction endonuclease type I HsdR N-terminal n=1 Tax=Penicillium waksmanii TaxID=69791 RepID=UPI0025495A28|nr:Restriction endonuclease type I HsdR N-terminal [Penicillium waksmanii]KAJ5980491.1 Restriction endonuclease type I HsdR N-terminal [Penicillium waksmanii]
MCQMERKWNGLKDAIAALTAAKGAQEDNLANLREASAEVNKLMDEIKKNPPVPTIGVTDAARGDHVDALQRGFGLRADPEWKDWMEPKHSEQLDGYYRKIIKSMGGMFQPQSFETNVDDEPCLRASLNALIWAINSTVQEMNPEGSRSLSIKLEQSMSYYPYRHDGENYRLQGRADYALWYGRRRDIDTNLIIWEAKGKAETNGECQLLLYMAMVHKKRCELGKKNRIVYGVLALPRYFEFIQIDNDGVYSMHFIKCFDDIFSAYVPLLTSIFMEAVALSPPGSEETDPVNAMEAV